MKVPSLLGPMLGYIFNCAYGHEVLVWPYGESKGLAIHGRW